MKKIAALLILLVLFGGIFVGGNIAHSQQLPEQDGWIVRLRDNVSPAADLAVLGDFKEYPIKAKGLHFGVIRPTGNFGLNEQSKIKSIAGVVNITPNYIIKVDDPMSTSDTPNDPIDHWWADALGLGFAWPTSTTQTIGLVDTGCADHPDLPPLPPGDRIKVLDGAVKYGDAPDTFGHGTHVRGIMTMIPNNGIGGAGVLWKVNRVVCIKAFSGAYATYADVSLGLVMARFNNVKFLNASWGGPDNDVLNDAVNFYLGDGGNFLFAACGNSGWFECQFPARYSKTKEGVIAIVALDQNLQRAWFSSYGGDFSSPGVSICSTLPAPTMYGCWSGTSMATPMAMAVAAAAYERNGGSGMNRLGFTNYVRSKAVDLGSTGFDPIFGWGMLDWKAIGASQKIYLPWITR